MNNKENEDDTNVVITTCASCEEPLYADKVLLACGACKMTRYCNQDCQKSHWKFHKLRCNQMQLAKQSSKEHKQKRLFRLFQEWKDECRDGMVDILIGYFGANRIQLMEPMRKVVYFKVDFHYNFQTFLPTELPTEVPVSAIQAPHADTIHSLYEEAKETLRHPPSHLARGATFAPVISYIEYAGNRSLIQTNMVEIAPAAPRVTTLAHMTTLLSDIKLTSKKFGKWDSHRNTNLEKGLSALEAENSFFVFIAHALRLQCQEPRNATHAVRLQVKEGFGLGEIEKLNRFEVVPQVPNKKAVFLEGSVASNASSSMPKSDIATLIVVFCGQPFYKQYSIDQVKERSRLTPLSFIAEQESDREALRAFVALTTVTLPSVESPDLN